MFPAIGCARYADRFGKFACHSAQFNFGRNHDSFYRKSEEKDFGGVGVLDFGILGKWYGGFL
jgi:hypothetical protein